MTKKKDLHTIGLLIFTSLSDETDTIFLGSPLSSYYRLKGQTMSGIKRPVSVQMSHVDIVSDD